MLNKVMLIGRLGKDPEIKYAQNGTPIANLSLATDESYTDKEGNKVERTEWHRVVVFQRQAENCKSYLAKGSLVFVEGSLQTRKWQDPQGQDRYMTEIKAQSVTFLDRKPQAGQGAQAGYGGQASQGGYGGQNAPDNYGAPKQPARQSQQNNSGYNEDLGPAFPSEASGMDDVPF